MRISTAIASVGLVALIAACGDGQDQSAKSSSPAASRTKSVMSSGSSSGSSTSAVSQTGGSPVASTSGTTGAGTAKTVGPAPGKASSVSTSAPGTVAGRGKGAPTSTPVPTKKCAGPYGSATKLTGMTCAQALEVLKKWHNAPMNDFGNHGSLTIGDVTCSTPGAGQEADGAVAGCWSLDNKKGFDTADYSGFSRPTPKETFHYTLNGRTMSYTAALNGEVRYPVDSATGQTIITDDPMGWRIVVDGNTVAGGDPGEMSCKEGVTALHSEALSVPGKYTFATPGTHTVKVGINYCGDSGDASAERTYTVTVK